MIPTSHHQQQQQHHLQQHQNQNQSEQQQQQSSSSDELNFTAFIDLCRFCAIKSGPRLNIFDKEAEQRQLLFKIRNILPIVINKEDFLPKKICDRCLAKIEQFFEWRTNCVQTDAILRNYADSMRVVTATINFQVSRGRYGKH
uniref:Putative dvir\gj22977-pa-like protein n=1 Tax=Culex tarsalis TaxID=7177 RepID=A0A1Q3FUC7_CULTA